MPPLSALGRVRGFSGQARKPRPRLSAYPDHHPNTAALGGSKVGRITALVICAVWASPSALLPSPYSPLQDFGGGRPPPRGCRHTALKIIACLLLGDSLGRERCRSFSIATQGSTTLRSVAMNRLRYAQSDHCHAPTLRSCPPPLCFTFSAPPRSLDQKAVFGTATQSQDYLCGVGFALRLVCSWVLLGRGRLSLPAVALPLSPSLASPPPSLRSGTSPAGGFMCLFRVCVPPFRHRLRRSLHIGTHKSG